MTTTEINNLNWVNLPNKLKSFFKSILTSLTSLGSRVTELESNQGGATPQYREAFLSINQNGTDVITSDFAVGCNIGDYNVRDAVGVYVITIDFDELDVNLPIYVTSPKSNVVVNSYLAGNELSIQSFDFTTLSPSDNIISNVLLNFKQFL